MNSTNSSSTLFGHPKGLYILFFTEMWERFAFYGMKGLLVFYLIKYHLFDDASGYEVAGAFAALGYGLPVLGGMIADRYLGMRKSVVFGATLLCLGSLGMVWGGVEAHVVNGEVVRDAMALSVMYLSLAFISVGVGFLKPNVSTIVGNLYEPDDPKREAGFTIFFMGINLGSLLAMLTCGYLGENWGWGWGFGLAAAGMLFGLIVFLWGKRFLAGHAEPPEPAKLKEKVFAGLNVESCIYLGSLAAVALVWLMVQQFRVVQIFQYTVVVGLVIGLGWYLTCRCTAIERSRMGVLGILMVLAVVFFGLYGQMFTSVALFTDRAVNLTVLGFDLTAPQITALNPLFIIICAAPLALFWLKLAKRNREPSTPFKFGLAIISAGIGCGVLVLGCHFAPEGEHVPFVWVMICYFFVTMGELLLSPVGLSAVTKLSVGKIVGLMMGVWFLAQSCAEIVTVQLAKLASFDAGTVETAALSEVFTNYSDLFIKLAGFGIGVGLLVLLFSPLLNKMMRGVR